MIARRDFTYLTASVELPQVRKAAEEAFHFFIDLFELQAAVGRHLAKMSGAESGMITSGSAGSIACATAGCIAGSDPKNIYQLPDKNLIDAALYNSTPWEGAICRPMKVGKEEMMACLAALDYWSKADIAAINKEWQRRMERLAKMVETVPGVQTSIKTPPPQSQTASPPSSSLGTNRSLASRWLNAMSN
jgi:hypothetical protein